MLKFFVLGEIPGTHFIITFSWVLAAAAVLLFVGEASALYRRHKLLKSKAK